MAEKTIIAMSGGVDSSVAALLTVKNSGEALGVTLKLYGGDRLACGSGADAADAKAVADILGIEHRVFDYGKLFEEKVVGDFVSAYRRCETPNPCIACNRAVKFGALMDEGERLGYPNLATGHYARTERIGERYCLKKALDPAKDQSYVLYNLTQAQLSKISFPLGELTKAEVREIAQSNGFANARKGDSQDICFIPDGNYAEFIEKYTGEKFPEGNFVDENGNVLGRHRGLIRYTVGQRRGLGLALPAPMYVRSLNPRDNTVTLCRDEELFSRELTAKSINLIAADEIKGELRVKAKIRYAHREQPATVIQTDRDELKIVVDEPQRAVTKGQSVVLYDGDIVVGGGIIS